MTVQGPASGPAQHISQSSTDIARTLGAFSLNPHKIREQLRQEVESHDPAIELDPAITLDPALFDQALTRLVSELGNEGKMNLSQILASRQFELHHNKWIIRVSTRVFESFLIQEPGLVERMREYLGEPRLFWEIIVDESLIQETHNRPMTSEERLLALKDRYPQLEAFLRKFNLSVRPDSGG